MRISTQFLCKAFALVGFVGVLASCGGIGGGGGGGGSSANYEGDLYLEVERDHIDSGDLNRITVEVANLNPSGSVLKFRISRSLRFVANSAVFFPGRDERRTVTPDVVDSTEYERYIVFFLDPREAIDEDYVSMQFTLRAVAGDEDGFIEVDLDNNDRTIQDGREFSADNAKFTAKDRRSIYIEPDSSMPTATPTVAASGTAGSGSGSSTPTPAATATASTGSGS
jgi:hypothetical protein